MITQTGAVLEAAVSEEASDIEQNLMSLFGKVGELASYNHIICWELSTVEALDSVVNRIQNFDSQSKLPVLAEILYNSTDSGRIVNLE